MWQIVSSWKKGRAWRERSVTFIHLEKRLVGGFYLCVDHVVVWSRAFDMHAWCMSTSLLGLDFLFKCTSSSQSTKTSTYLTNKIKKRMNDCSLSHRFPLFSQLVFLRSLLAGIVWTTQINDEIQNGRIVGMSIRFMDWCAPFSGTLTFS